MSNCSEEDCFLNIWTFYTSEFAERMKLTITTDLLAVVSEAFTWMAVLWAYNVTFPQWSIWNF